MSDTYICAMCKEEFNKGWSDEEAIAELQETCPGIDSEDCDIVCDDCYNMIMA